MFGSKALAATHGRRTTNNQPAAASLGDDQQPWYERRIDLWLYNEHYEGPVTECHTRCCIAGPFLDDDGHMTHTPVYYLKRVDSNGDTVSTYDYRFRNTYNSAWEIDDGSLGFGNDDNHSNDDDEDHRGMMDEVSSWAS